MPSLERRTEKIDFRVTPSMKAKLQAAATTLNRNLSDFVLESAEERADETLADRNVFRLNPNKWEEFMQALDAPIRPMPRMKELLSNPGYFDLP